MSSRAWVFGAVLLGAGAMAAAGLAQTMDGRRGGAYAIIGPECMATGLSFREPSAEVKLDRSRRGTSFDGGGGIDTFALAGPAFSVLHADRFRSLERIDTENGASQLTPAGAH